MRRPCIITILFLTCLTLSNCNRSKTTGELMNAFSDNKTKLNTIVNNIQTHKGLDSLFYEVGAERGIPDIKIDYPKLYELLREVGITDASAHKGACHQMTTNSEEQNKALEPWYKLHSRPKWYYFKTNWQIDHPIFLIYNECDTAKTRKGFYNKDEKQNESWGLGDNWAMFRFVQYLDYKQ